jgi:ribonuclease HII
MEAFPDRELRIIEETPQRSAYKLNHNGTSWTFDFAVEADQHRLPVALASMTAKYVREVLMTQFNAYWRQDAPQVAPTAGYYTDAKRFLKEITPLMTPGRPPLEHFVRAK